MRRESVDQTQHSTEISQSELSGEVLNLLRLARNVTGFSLDFWADFTEGLDTNSVALLVLRAEMLGVEMQKGVSRDAQLGRFVRDINSTLASPKFAACHSGASGGGSDEQKVPNYVLRRPFAEGRLAIGDVVQAFEVVHPKGSEGGCDGDVGGLWPALGDEDRRIVSDVVRRLST